jgi:hypothetical protein
MKTEIDMEYQPHRGEGSTTDMRNPRKLRCRPHQFRHAIRTPASADPPSAGGIAAEPRCCAGVTANKGRRLGPVHAGGSVPWQELQLRDTSASSEVVLTSSPRSGEVRRLEVRMRPSGEEELTSGDSNVSEIRNPSMFL